MVKEKTTTPVIRIEGTKSEVTSMFLRVFLAKERLTEKQLAVTTELVLRYTNLIMDEVREPYASTLLFSAENRKDIVSSLKISAAHLNNTFNALIKKNILDKSSSGYMINPSLVVSGIITFKFSVVKE